jgi:hypothetical protein
MPGAAGFNAPSILFLNTWDAPERAFVRPLFAALLAERGYTRYVEPCAGSFVMPLVAREAGWTPDRMECSDVSLYTAICGTLLSRGDFRVLDVRVEGRPAEVDFDAEPAMVAAELLWIQLCARMDAKPDVEYWRAIRRDLREQKAAHVGPIAEKLRELDRRIGGLTYRPMDLTSHMEAVADDPHTVININAPTYKAGFERFYDTKGRLTWAAPDYTIFDPADGVATMLRQLEGRAALLLTLQQAEPGHAAHPMPIYGRHLAPGQVVYYLANRPDEVFSILGGPKAKPRLLPSTTPLPRKVLPVDYPITEAAQVVLLPVKGSQAAYYKDLWLHRMTPKSAGQDMLVLLDGHVAGLFGYDLSPLVRPYNDKWRDAAILTYALGAPHARRTTRLVTMLALQREALAAATTTSKSIHPGMARKLVTSEFTRHPEAKGLRGLMRLASRTKDPKAGYKLVYSADLEDHGLAAVIGRWLDREDRYERTRTAEPEADAVPVAAVAAAT